MSTTNIPTLYRSFNVLLEALDVYFHHDTVMDGCTFRVCKETQTYRLELGETHLELHSRTMTVLNDFPPKTRSAFLRLSMAVLMGLHKLAYHDHKHHGLNHGKAFHSRLHKDGSLGLPRRLSQAMGLDPHNEAQLKALSHALKFLSSLSLSIPDPKLPRYILDGTRALPTSKAHTKTRQKNKKNRKTPSTARLFIKNLISFPDPTEEGHTGSIPAQHGRAGGTYGMVQLAPELLTLALHRFVPCPDVVLESGDVRYMLSSLTVLTEKHAFNRGKDEVDIELGRASRDMRTTQHARPGWARDLNYFHANMARMIEDGLLQGYRIVNHIVTFFFDATQAREAEPPDPLTSPQPTDTPKRARKKIPVGFFQRLVPLPLQPG